jgi:hypothetical protein
VRGTLKATHKKRRHANVFWEKFVYPNSIHFAKLLTRLEAVFPSPLDSFDSNHHCNRARFESNSTSRLDERVRATTTNKRKRKAVTSLPLEHLALSSSIWKGKKNFHKTERGKRQLPQGHHTRYKVNDMEDGSALGRGGLSSEIGPSMFPSAPTGKAAAGANQMAGGLLKTLFGVAPPNSHSTMVARGGAVQVESSGPYEAAFSP